MLFPYQQSSWTMTMSCIVLENQRRTLSRIERISYNGRMMKNTTPRAVVVIALRDMTSSSAFVMECCSHFFMMDSERPTMTSWQRSIATFYLGCMVSEITRFYCKPDMTSSSFLRQGALHATFLGGLWKIDHHFLIVIHTNFLATMHGFRDK